MISCVKRRGFIMSELITRRTFLKAAGTAMAAAAAGGMLAGCGNRADALLSVSARTPFC